MFGFSSKKENSNNHKESFDINLKKANDTNFIFYDKGKKFAEKIEFYAVLRNNPEIRKLILVDCNISLSMLCHHIAENFEQLPQYDGLEGLQVHSLSKKDGVEEIIIPSTGQAVDYIKSGDFIYFDLITNEYWTKFILQLKSKNSSQEFAISMDLKIKKGKNFAEIKYFILKCALKFWDDSLEDEHDEGTYYVYDFNIREKKSKKYLDDDINIGDILNFDSEVECFITFYSLEETLYDILKSNPLNLSTTNLHRWEEFKESNFLLIKTMEKFKPEYKYIKAFVKNIIKLHREKVPSNWYLFKDNKNFLKKDYDDENTDQFESDNDSSSVKLGASKKIIFIFPKHLLKRDPIMYGSFAVDSSSDSLEKYMNYSDKEMQSIGSLGENEVSPSPINNNPLLLNLSFEDGKTNKKENTNAKRNKGRHKSVMYEAPISSSSINSIGIVTPKKPRNSQDLKELSVNPNKKMSFAGYSSGIANKILRKDSALKGLTFKIGDYRNVSKYNNLVKDFKILVNIEKFVEMVQSNYNPQIMIGYLEKLNRIEFRDIKRLEKYADFEVNKFKSNQDEINKTERKEVHRENIMTLILLFILLVCFILYMVIIYYDVKLQ